MDAPQHAALRAGAVRAVRILFSTQGESLRVFENVLREIEKETPIERAGFIVANSMFYGEWLREQPDFERRGYALLKEWEITQHRSDAADLTRLARFEAAVGGEPGLFGA